MNKADVIDAMARLMGSARADGERALNAFCDAVSEGLVAGGDVAILGFGTFRRSVRKARVGRNPTTKEPIQIPASIAVTFRPGKALKDRVNS